MKFCKKTSFAHVVRETPTTTTTVSNSECNRESNNVTIVTTVTNRESNSESNSLVSNLDVLTSVSLG